MKRNIKFFIMIILLLGVVFSVYGRNISVLIIQKDGLEKVSEASKVFENQIMNTLFDYGHIVTNETISLYENYEMASVNGFNAAVDGFMDYFIEVILEYDISKSNNPEAIAIENIRSVEYTIKSVYDGSIYFKSGKVVPNLDIVTNQYVGFNKFACEIADSINLKVK